MQTPLQNVTVKFLYHGVVAKVQSPEALFSLGVVPVVIFATIKSKEMKSKPLLVGT